MNAESMRVISQQLTSHMSAHYGHDLEWLLMHRRGVAMSYFLAVPLGRLFLTWAAPSPWPMRNSVPVPKVIV